MTPPGALRTLLGDHPATRAVRRGEVRSARLPLAFTDVEVPNRAFRRVVRDLEFDVAELALMTFLMARSRDAPLRLLPVVVFSRNPLPHLIGGAGLRGATAGSWRGLRIGVRSYTTTTAVWIRALLAEQFGVRPGDMEWVALEEAHVAGVADPAGVRRAAAGADLMALLGEGAIDAAIVDRVPADPRFAPVVADSEEVYRAWRQRHGARAVNHMIVVRDSLAEDAAAMRELLRLFRESREAAGAGIDDAPIGLAANRRNLGLAIAVAEEQGLLARPLTVDELVGEVIASIE